MGRSRANLRAAFAALVTGIVVTACSAPAPKVTLLPGETPPEEAPVVVRPVVVVDRIPEEMAKAIGLLKEKNYHQAEANFEEIIRLRPDIAEAHFNLAWSRYQLTRFAPAIAAARAGLERRPTEIRGWLLLALSERELGHFAEAEASYRAALALAPDDTRLHFNAGILYDLYLLKPADALRHFRRYQALQKAADPKVAGWIALLERKAPK
jgi:tetratricopeptide (TPR) repeat protein